MMVISTDMAISPGPMAQATRVSSAKIKSKEKVSIHGQMEGSMKAIGSEIRCMVLVFSPIEMEGYTKESLSKTRRMAMVSALGPTVNNMMDCGNKVNSMVRGISRIQKGKDRDASGIKVS